MVDLTAIRRWFKFWRWFLHRFPFNLGKTAFLVQMCYILFYHNWWPVCTFGIINIKIHKAKTRMSLWYYSFNILENSTSTFLWHISWSIFIVVSLNYFKGLKWHSSKNSKRSPWNPNIVRKELFTKNHLLNPTTVNMFTNIFYHSINNDY